jgi:hypothetical protein
MKTVNQLRAAFWQLTPEFSQHYRKTWRQNRYNATIRSAWTCFVDAMHRDGNISDSLAKRAIL